MVCSAYKKGSIRRLKVAYNDALRILLKVTRCQSASHLFVTCGIHTCEALLRHSMYGFMSRLDESQNSIIEGIVNPAKSCFRFSSRLRKHWRVSLYVWFYVVVFIIILLIIFILFLYIVVNIWTPCVSGIKFELNVYNARTTNEQAWRSFYISGICPDVTLRNTGLPCGKGKH